MGIAIYIQRNRKKNSSALFEEVILKYNAKMKNLNGLRLARTKYGKPYCRALRRENIDFNISYSDEFSIMGIKDNGKIGVDIESTENFPMESVSEFCSERELMMLANRMDSNLACKLWTIKEACSKCMGKGLSQSLKKMEIIKSDDKDVFLVCLKDKKWSVRTYFYENRWMSICWEGINPEHVKLTFC